MWFVLVVLYVVRLVAIHIPSGSTFTSTATRKTYSVVSPNPSLTCATENVIYLITCKKCGIQYIGETGQKLRNRLNNHRNRLRQLSNLYLYQHFNSDGHSEEDILVLCLLKKLHLIVQ